MSTYELLDELEAGELSVQYEGEEPQALLAWAIEEFSPRIAISAAFQADDVALIDMAYKIDPNVRIFTVDTGRLPHETHELIEALRAKYDGLNLHVLQPDAGQVQRLVASKGLELMKESVENRLLCCNVRKVQPLTKHLDGLDAWVTGLRRDQWATRTNIRKVEIDHDHGAIVKLNPLAEWTKREVWAYLGRARRAGARPLRAGLHVDRLRSVHARHRPGRGRPRRTLVVGVERAEGVRHALLDRARRLRARAEGDHRQGNAEGALRVIAVHGDAAEVALGEAQAVLAMVQDEERRGRLADLVAAVQEGELGDDEAQALEELIELGLSTGRIRSVYGPEGEQAALKTFRKLPGGRALSESAKEVSSALDALEGRVLESVKVQSAGPGAYVVSVAVEGLELSVKLDRAGARIHSVGV